MELQWGGFVTAKLDMLILIRIPFSFHVQSYIIRLSSQSTKLKLFTQFYVRQMYPLYSISVSACNLSAVEGSFKQSLISLEKDCTNNSSSSISHALSEWTLSAMMSWGKGRH